MGETSMTPSSPTQAPAEGVMQKLTVEPGQAPTSSGHISADAQMFPVRVTTSEATVLIRVDIELMRRQQETEEANAAIRRRLRG
jgi:hypothetical protein